MEVTILGNNSALPANGRHPTAQFVKTHTHQLLIDCGEGTQIQFSKYKLKQSKLDYILISHLHGDHFFGLPGMLTSLNLLGHEQDMHIFGPPKLEHVLNTIFEAGNVQLRYKILFHGLTPEIENYIVQKDRLDISSFPISHRIPTWGFRIIEKNPQRNIIPKYIEDFNLTYEEIRQLKHGKSITNQNGQSITADMVTKPLRPPCTYAYCSDTDYNESIIKYIQSVNCLYHESTFMEVHLKKAKETMHSTAKQAAQIALKARAGKLLLGHYSSRYEDLHPLLEEARSVFPNSVLSEEGITYKI